MTKPRLVKITYKDTKNSIRLDCYADAIVCEKSTAEKGTLVAIRFGGYPEQVRALSDAIYGGGSIEAEIGSSTLTLNSLCKQYVRQSSVDGAYAEATLFARDDSDQPTARTSEDAKKQGEEQLELESAARTCYLFTPVGDRARLFEEIDNRICVPLITAFQDYLLSELERRGFLKQLSVFSLNEQFDAWTLNCTPGDKNMIQVIEYGLKSGAISIPNSTSENSKVFDGINTVSQYLKEFGVTIAERIKSQFVPLFDPATEPVCAELLEVSENIQQHAGYHLYDAQLAAAEGLKRKIDKYEPALLVAECGSGKSVTRSIVKSYGTKTISFWRTGNPIGGMMG